MRLDVLPIVHLVLTCNWTKVIFGVMLWILGVLSHTAPYSLDHDEHREGTPMTHVADNMPYLIVIGGLSMCGIGYLDGKAPLHGSWVSSEIVAAGIALLALVLRYWAVRCLDSFFTFRVGIRKGHRWVIQLSELMNPSCPSRGLP